MPNLVKCETLDLTQLRREPRDRTRNHHVGEQHCRGRRQQCQPSNDIEHATRVAIDVAGQYRARDGSQQTPSLERQRRGRDIDRPKSVAVGEGAKVGNPA